jgi:ribosomal-protein-alanine N-acetyltransferase
MESIQIINGIVIREMRPSDLDTVMKIERASFSIPWRRAHFLQEMNVSEISVSFVAEKDGKVLGYGVIWVLPGKIHLCNIAVSNSYRRQGIGSNMLEHVLDYARKKKIPQVTLEVREGNKPAIELYKKYGFILKGKRLNYYTSEKENALILTKELF